MEYMGALCLGEWAQKLPLLYILFEKFAKRLAVMDKICKNKIHL